MNTGLYHNTARTLASKKKEIEREKTERRVARGLNLGKKANGVEITQEFIKTGGHQAA
jgi:hypothetical protein